MLTVRSFVFNVVFYVNMILWSVALIPTYMLPRKVFMRGARAWAWSVLWLLRVICGIRHEFRGMDKLPAGGFLVASKHQSFWETIVLFCVLDDPAFVMKRELQWIPIYGWFTAKARSIPIDRRSGSSALTKMTVRAREEAASGRQIVIFPEGTRTMPGAAPAYKYGIAHMYAQMNMPCVPIGLNSGVFWPRRQFLRRPGTIVIEIMEPIAPGMDRDAFFALMKDRIEASSDRLYAEASVNLH